MKGFRYPQRGRNNYKVVLLIAEHGPMTLEQGIKRHGHLSPKRGVTRKIYDFAVSQGHMQRHGNVYGLPDFMQSWAEGRIAFENRLAEKEAAKPKVDLVPPRQINVFKGKGYKPTYMQCMRQQPEWVKPDSFGFVA